MKNRDPYFDNVKFILISFVVLSHFGFELKDESLAMHGWVNVMTSFVVPAFAIISGHFSVNIRQPRKEDITHLLMPYLIMEIIHLLFTKVSGLGKGDVHFETPTYQNWYLLALFIWRLLLPYYSFVTPLKGLILSVLIGFSVGFFSGFNAFLDLHRILFMMPYFLVGYYWRTLRTDIDRLSKYKYWFAVLFFANIGTIYLLSLRGTQEAGKILYLYAPMFGYGGDLTNAMLRTLTFTGTFITALSFLIIAPRNKTIFTEAGTRTMYVYLFHMFIVWPLVKLMGHYQAGLTELISFASSILIAFLLSLPLAEKVLKPILYPPFFRSDKP